MCSMLNELLILFFMSSGLFCHPVPDGNLSSRTRWELVMAGIYACECMCMCMCVCVWRVCVCVCVSQCECEEGYEWGR